MLPAGHGANRKPAFLLRFRQGASQPLFQQAYAFTRATLAIPGYPLLFGGFLLMSFVGRHRAYTTLPWWMMGIGGILSFPLLNAQDRQQRTQREATRKVEANRLRPINPTWTNAILAFGALPGLVVGAAIGYQLFGPNGAALGIIPPCRTARVGDPYASGNA